MINVNKFENRIVKFKRIDSEGNESDKEAEVRRMDYDQNEDIPRSVTARLVDPLNFVITLGYDKSKKKFSGPLGTDIWESNFDIDDFIESSKMGIADRYMKSPKRNRARFWGTATYSEEEHVKNIPIEERNSDELSYVEGLDENNNLKKVLIYPKKSKVLNLAFDITPAKYVTGLITEKGVCEASKEGLKKLFKWVMYQPT